MKIKTRSSIRNSKFRKKTTLLILGLTLAFPITALAATTYTTFGVYWFDNAYFPATTYGNSTFAIHYTNRAYSHTGWVRVGANRNNGGSTWVGKGSTSYTWVKGAWNGAHDGGPISSATL